jgi:ABC-type transport system involved in Fe-S cluster assembly fused permease/ATPase subunit
MENNLVLNDAGIINNNIDGQIIKSQTLFSSVFCGLVLAVKVVLLFALSIIYSVIALTAFILYLIFFKRLVNILVKKIRQGKPASSYSYKWKNHHLDLNWEA